MNNISLSKLRAKTFFATLCVILLNLILLTGCSKKDGDQNVSPGVTADSSSISSLIVSCKSSDASTTGFAVIDIQEFFLSKKLVSSDIKGKVLSVKSANESDFKAVINKLILDLQVPESYFTNYDSFRTLIEDRFKPRTGYQKAYDINQPQIEQLFNKQDVSLAFQGNFIEETFLRNIVFASAGFGTVRLGPLAETFTLNRFQGLVTVGARTTGPSNGVTLKSLFGTGASRSTSLTKDDQVVYISFISGISGSSGYSYSYPLPPSPAPVFDAPVWYWQQYRPSTTGANVTIIPSGASTTTWPTAQDRYEAIRLKSQQVTGITVGTRTLLISSNPNISDAETAYLAYTATFTQRYKDPTLTLWVAYNTQRRELYQIAYYETGSMSILKFINASIVNGNYIGDPSWSIGWNK